jgi:hypothetical protein
VNESFRAFATNGSVAGLYSVLAKIGEKERSFTENDYRKRTQQKVKSDKDQEVIHSCK